MVKKLLIIGDSFSANTDAPSWTMCIDNYVVDNVSMCGSSEYRLIKKLNSIDTTKYSKVIFVHTSPNRIYVETNPYYSTSTMYRNCDLLYADMHARLPDQYAADVVWWFENVFDIEQAEFTHSLLVDYAVKKLPNAVHMTFFDYQLPEVKSLHSVWKAHPGSINHMSAQGNVKVLNFLKQYI
jgi:hypothetical protein